MTLLDLWKIIKPKAIIIVVLSIVCFLACYGINRLLTKETYSAQATITVSEQSSIAGSMATKAAAKTSTENVTVSATTSITTGSVTITASGSNGDACVSAANSALAETQSEFTGYVTKALVSVNTASSAVRTTPSQLKYPIMAFFACLFICVIFLVIKDIAMGTIHDWTTVERKYKIPYLGSLGGSDAEKERLLAGVCLAGKASAETTRNICLMPIGKTTVCESVMQQLASTPSNTPVDISAAEPLSKGSSAIYTARNADSVIFVVEAERSLLKDLDAAVRELKVANVTPAGFIYSKKIRG